MDNGVKEKLKLVTKPLYEAAVKDMERRRRNEHMLVLRLMHASSTPQVYKPVRRLYIYSRLEAEKGIGAALLRDPFFKYSQ